MKRASICICVILIVSLILNVPVFADDAAPYSSYYFASYDAATDVVAFRTFRVWFDVMSNGIMDELGSSQIIVQQSSNGTSWTNVKTCLPEDYSQMIEENTYGVCNYITCTGIPGYYYRAYVTFYAKNSSGIGKISQYSEVVWLTNQP